MSRYEIEFGPPDGRTYMILSNDSWSISLNQSAAHCLEYELQTAFPWSVVQIVALKNLEAASDRHKAVRVPSWSKNNVHVHPILSVLREQNIS